MSPLTLVYLSWGEGRHVAQLHFSVLSALRFGDPLDIVLFATRPDDYRTLPVQVVALTDQQLTQWRQPSGATYVVKLEALRRALERSGRPVVFIDADTYFRTHPLRLAVRLSEDGSVLHMREYRFGDVRPRARFAELFADGLRDADGLTVRFDRRLATWNAGVTGVHPANARAVDDAIHLTHQVEQRIPGTGLSEQLSIAHCLTRHTTVRAADDVVYHYWPYVSRPELQRLPELVEATAQLPAPERGRELMRHAFRPSLQRRSRQRARRALERAGALPRAPRFSL